MYKDVQTTSWKSHESLKHVQVSSYVRSNIKKDVKSLLTNKKLPSSRNDLTFHKRNLCVKSVRIRSYSGPYSVKMRENTDQNNSKYGHFSRSDYYIIMDHRTMDRISQKLINGHGQRELVFALLAGKKQHWYNPTVISFVKLGPSP